MTSLENCILSFKMLIWASALPCNIIIVGSISQWEIMTSENSVISIGHHVMIAYCVICSKL